MTAPAAPQPLFEGLLAFSDSSSSITLNPPSVLMRNTDRFHTVWIYTQSISAPAGWAIRPGETLSLAIPAATTFYSYTDAPAQNGVSVEVITYTAAS